MWPKNTEKSIRLSSSSSVCTSTKIDGNKKKQLIRRTLLILQKRGKLPREAMSVETAFQRAQCKRNVFAEGSATKIASENALMFYR